MLLASVILSACSFSEDVREADYPGTIVIPRAAATRPLYTPTGEYDNTGKPIYTSEDVTDTRYIGPVYIGLFSAIDTTSFAYPHPAMGPVVDADEGGNTYPYGGTTVGRFDFACYESLACGVVTGRFTDYADILDFYKTNLLRPVVDSEGTEVTSASAFQQRCFDYYYATTDEEMAFIGEDQFVENADGDFEATFSMNHTIGVEGSVVWGFMDSPEIDTNVPESTNPGFTTCDDSVGRDAADYNHEWKEGGTPVDVLNHPNQYITPGDWVADGSTVLELSSTGGTTDDLVLTLNTQVE